VLFVGKRFRNAIEVRELIPIVYPCKMHIKYSRPNRQSLGRKCVGTAFPLKNTA